ncbi:hypothetical protein M431DRAFT_253363 [Trichoderma harzianum CBS 226.95]|uniref:Uncharacterized protein n=1 Tax=Trichoderma harzianum CBS 226.95 TaxID=983964 RepID=A0A2T4A062_TRIHA|nr:hypothetical protein M431DRAFT_253363 [Trichoderma harzianum CBS 226.95]PTB50451.1 hypothetical protein M431DRAFT_253363 [Trichoderma harzianum CBS 226.95]
MPSHQCPLKRISPSGGTKKRSGLVTLELGLRAGFISTFCFIASTLIGLARWPSWLWRQVKATLTAIPGGAIRVGSSPTLVRFIFCRSLTNGDYHIVFSFFGMCKMCGMSVLLDDINLPTTSCKVHMYRSNLKYDGLPINHNPSAMQSVPDSEQCNQTPVINRS